MKKDYEIIKDRIVGGVMILAMIMVTVWTLATPQPSHEYYKSAEVVRIYNNNVYLEDTDGNVWLVEDDTLKMNVRYILIMNDNNTLDIKDDEILRIE